MLTEDAVVGWKHLGSRYPTSLQSNSRELKLMTYINSLLTCFQTVFLVLGVVSFLALGATVVCLSAPGAHFHIHVCLQAIIAGTLRLLRLALVELGEFALSCAVVLEPYHIALQAIE